MIEILTGMHRIKWQSYLFCSKSLLLLLRGGVHWRLGCEGLKAVVTFAHLSWWYFLHKLQVAVTLQAEKRLFRLAVFSGGSVTECGGTDGEFLSSCKLQETLPATTLLLFGVVMLLCGFKFGTFLFYLLMKDLFLICQTVNTITLSHSRPVQPAYRLDTPDAVQHCCFALPLAFRFGVRVNRPHLMQRFSRACQERLLHRFI